MLYDVIIIAPVVYAMTVFILICWLIEFRVSNITVSMAIKETIVTNTVSILWYLYNIYIYPISGNLNNNNSTILALTINNPAVASPNSSY